MTCRECYLTEVTNRELALDEWYHCYSRGVDKRTVFESDADFTRFTQLLYLANSSAPLQRSEFSRAELADIYSTQRGSALVAVGAYCLMPNHFHILVRPVCEDGLSEFMRKVGIGYTKYFNTKNERIGNLFVKPFRAKHVSDDDYFRRVADYIHLNPAELFESGWKEGRVNDLQNLEVRLRNYLYSSLPDYLGKQRPQKAILNDEDVSLIGSRMPNIRDLISDTFAYYRDLPR